MMRAVAIAAMLACGTGAGAAECVVPDGLALGEIALPLARARLARAGKLVVMTVGGAATAGTAAGDVALSYPAQLKMALAAGLPGVPVEVVNRATPGHGTGYAARSLTGALAEVKPALVIWGTGAREMARSADLDVFADGLQAGIDAVHRAGADIILLDLQYAPSIARITNAEPYRRVLHGAAAANDLALLPRYDLMLAWNDTGVLDLDAQTVAARQSMARRLFECLAAALATPIARGLR